MKTLPADLEALMPEPVGFRSRYRSEPEMIGHYPWTWAGAERRRRKYDRPECEYEDLFTADQVREAMLAATERAQDDTRRLDWIVRQADEFSCSTIVDAPGDGEYIVHGMDGYGQGKTPREAIDNAMRFNAAAAIRSGGEAGEPT